MTIVTASGEIKPRNYINIGANARARITEILVKEGDRVRKGQLLAKIENDPAGGRCEAQKAALSSAEADSSASKPGSRRPTTICGRMQAPIDQDKADLEHAKAGISPRPGALQAKLIAKQDFDQRKSHLRSAAGRRAAKPRPG